MKRAILSGLALAAGAAAAVTMMRRGHQSTSVEPISEPMTGGLPHCAECGRFMSPRTMHCTHCERVAAGRLERALDTGVPAA